MLRGVFVAGDALRIARSPDFQPAIGLSLAAETPQ